MTAVRTLSATAVALAAVLALALAPPLASPVAADESSLRPARPAARDASSLQLISTERLGPRLLELTLRTPALAEPTRVRVLRPTDYRPGTGRRYPVLYLLHGGADDYTSWTRPGAGEAERATAGLPLIVVMPDAGEGGWYTDWYNNGAWGRPMWETYHIDQLVPWIDAHFPTIPDRGHRAIAGLSMGGFGAMSYAARHPDLFVAASSWSGAVDTNTPPAASAHVIDLFAAQDGGVPGSLWGMRETQEVRWRGHNPWDLAENLREMTLAVRTGNGRPGGPYGGGGEPLEAGVHMMSVSFHQRLAALEIPHVWDDYGPGGHTWPYWNRDLRRDLPRIMATFADPPPAPSPFTYTAIEPAYEVFGWRVAVDRPVLEFSTLRDASASGFTLRGSGRATVTTAALYVPCAPHVVTIRSEDGTTRRIRRSDAHGRLRVAVPLGPANPVQQYTVPGTKAGTTVYETAVAVARIGRTGERRPPERDRAPSCVPVASVRGVR